MKAIHVTQADIEKGTPNMGSCCPVARAILRESGATDVDVAIDEISLWGLEGETVNVVPPRSVARFIENFDVKGRAAVNPFKFKLDI